ncbi:hypothetical protein ACS0TY_006331 [Phlomoides rotata]
MRLNMGNAKEDVRDGGRKGSSPHATVLVEGGTSWGRGGSPSTPPIPGTVGRGIVMALNPYGTLQGVVGSSGKEIITLTTRQLYDVRAKVMEDALIERGISADPQRVGEKESVAGQKRRKFERQRRLSQSPQPVRSRNLLKLRSLILSLLEQGQDPERKYDRQSLRGQKRKKPEKKQDDNGKVPQAAPEGST